MSRTGSLGWVELHMYRNEAEHALAAVERSWPWLARSTVARAQMANSFALHFRGTAALAVLRVRGGDGPLSVVRDCAKQLSRLDLPYAAAHRAILDAGLALHAGDLTRGAKHLNVAVAGFEENDMAMYAAAARRRLGELLRGDEGQALLALGDAAMRARRVVDLDAMTEMLCADCRAP